MTCNTSPPRGRVSYESTLNLPLSFFIHYIHYSLNVVFIFICSKAVMFLPVLLPDEKLNFCTMLSLVYYF